MTICAYLLPIEDIVVSPKLTDAEAFLEPTIFIGFCEKPSCIHEILAFRVHDIIAYPIRVSPRLQNKSP